MPSACDNENTPAVTPAPLPSILDIGRHAMAAVRLGNSLGDLGDKPGSDATNSDAQMLAYRRKDALAALAMSLPAKTLGDAAAQLFFAYDVLAWLGAVQIDEGRRDRAMSRVVRAILSAAPVVACAAGIPFQDVDLTEMMDNEYDDAFQVSAPRVPSRSTDTTW